jgi:hypothetical protein
MEPASEEKDVIGLPRNSFQRFGRIQAVMVRCADPSIAHVRPRRAPKGRRSQAQH